MIYFPRASWHSCSGRIKQVWTALISEAISADRYGSEGQSGRVVQSWVTMVWSTQLEVQRGTMMEVCTQVECGMWSTDVP